MAVGTLGGLFPPCFWAFSFLRLFWGGILKLLSEGTWVTCCPGLSSGVLEPLHCGGRWPHL